MIKSTYKTWIIFFILINITLLVWSLEFFYYFDKENTEEVNLNIIKPEQEFRKSLPPKDESFPNEKSKVWSAFEDNKIIEDKDMQQADKEESLLDNQIKKIDNEKQDKNNLLKKEKSKSDEGMISGKEIENSKVSSKENKKKPVDVSAIKNPEVKKNDTENFVFYVQIASLSKKKLVQKEWDRLKNKYSKNMKNLKYISQEANLKDNRTFYRLLVGKFKNKSMAKNFCEKLNIKANCIIKKIYE